MKSAVEIMALVGLALGIFLIALYWMNLPPQVPSHYNISGQVDKWSAKGSILLLPLIGAFVYAIINILSHYPKIFNYPWKFAPQYLAFQQELALLLLSFLKMEIVWLMTIIEWQTIRIARGQAGGLGPGFLIISSIVIFGTIIIYLIRSHKAR